MTELVRKFETGATRSADTGKYDYEGFLSPLVVEEFGRFMNKHRVQPDGTLRDSDNWQKGITTQSYMKSAWRHFFSWWKMHRGHEAKDEKGNPVDFKEEICALIFNAQGYLHELIKKEEKK